MATDQEHSVTEDEQQARTVRGIGVSPGRGAGPGAQMAAPIAEPRRRRGLHFSSGRDAAQPSVAEHGQRVAQGLEEAAQRAGGASRDVLQTTAQMATDPMLVTAAQAYVRDERLSPPWAVWEAAADVAGQLTELGGYMAERVRDVVDVRDRLGASLAGLPTPGGRQRHDPFARAAGR